MSLRFKNLYFNPDKVDGQCGTVTRKDWRKWGKISRWLAYDVFKGHIKGTGTSDT